MKKSKIKSLSDFKDDLHRCSKCGICQQACPLFKSTGNECTVSRGQFIMLNGVVEGDLRLNKNINKYLDLCLKCNKCTEYCPVEIDALDIILTAKGECFRHSFWGNVYKFIESRLVFDTILFIVSKICGLTTKKYKSKQFEKKAVYFGGCISKLRPKVNNYVTKVLNLAEIEVVDVGFNCCGMPFLTTGNIERFIYSAIENIEKIPDGVEYVVTDCASCAWAWRQYVKYIDDEGLKERLKKIRFVSVYEIIAEKELRFKANKPTVITYHNPCHEEYTDGIVNILKNIEGAEYRQLEGMDECCGFAAFEHPAALGEVMPIMDKKRDCLKSTKADYVLTSCVGCLVSLGILTLFRQKTKRVVEFLMDNCVIK